MKRMRPLHWIGAGVVIIILLAVRLIATGWRIPHPADPAIQTPSRLASNSQSKAASITRRGVAEALRKGRSAGGSKESLMEFEANLLLLAEQEGVAPMTLAARLVLDAGALDEQEMAQYAVRIAFADTTSQVELAKALPAGRLRELATGNLGTQLVAAGDLQGLRDVYNSLPVGKDRSRTAERAAKLTMNQLGLCEALDFVVSLEMPEERYIAFFATREQWKPHWNDDGVAAKMNAVIESLDKEGRMRLAPMIRKTK
jgi:hypothetical protein